MEPTATKKTFKKFFYFLLGQQFSLLGSSLVFFVISWWITIETNNPLFLSFSAVLYFIPQILIAPIAGVLVDRLNRKFIIILIDSVQALVTLGLALLFFFNITNVWIVLIVNTIRSVLQAFHTPTYNAIVPSMVPKDRLNRINGLNSLFSSFIFLVGPIIGGILITYFPITQIFMIDVLTFLIALVPLLLISIPSVREPHEEREKSSFFKEFKVGLITIRAVPGLMSLILLATLLNFLIRPFTELMPFFIYNNHNGTAIELAFVIAFMPVAHIIGSTINTFKKSWKHKTLVIMIGSITVFIGYSFLIIAPFRFFLLMGLGLFIQGISFNFIIINYMTILQSAVSPDKVGRIVSLDHSLTFIIMPIGSIVSGMLTNLIGITNVYLIFIIIAISISVLVWLFTDINDLDHIGRDEDKKII